MPSIGVSRIADQRGGAQCYDSANGMASIWDTAVLRADAIERELKRIGLWSAEALPPAAYQYRGAFAMDTMSFEQWLQFVLLPEIRRAADAQQPLPKETMVGTRGIIEFDGLDHSDALISQLCQLEAWLNSLPD